MDHAAGAERGFNPENVAMMTVSPPVATYAQPPDVVGFYARLLERVRALPGVASAASGTAVLQPLIVNSGLFSIEGQPLPPPEERIEYPVEIVSPGYFETIGMTIARGRAFTDADDANVPRVVVINGAGVDERWCLGDLVGGEPPTAELLGAARQLDLLIAGNHDAWALGPDRVVARGRDVFRLSSRAMASRHGIDCWHGSPRHPLLGFLTEASAARILPGRPLGSLGLVGHTHEPALFAYDGAATRAVRPVPGESYDWLAAGACMANPGAVCGNPRDAASWWLIVDIDARVLRWHRKEFESEEAAAAGL